MFKTLVLFAAIVFAASVCAQTQTTTPAPKKIHHPTDTVGVINGVVVTLREYRGELKQTMKVHMSEIPNGKVSDSLYTKFVNLTWDKMIRDVLVEQEIKKLKLEISDTETARRLLKDKPQLLKQNFVDSAGVFHDDAYRQFLSMARPDDTLRDQVLRYFRISYQLDGLYKALAPKATTDEARAKAFEAWIAKRAAHADIDDRRTAFGFY